MSSIITPTYLFKRDVLEVFDVIGAGDESVLKSIDGMTDQTTPEVTRSSKERVYTLIHERRHSPEILKALLDAFRPVPSTLQSLFRKGIYLFVKGLDISQAKLSKAETHPIIQSAHKFATALAKGDSEIQKTINSTMKKLKESEEKELPRHMIKASVQNLCEQDLHQLVELLITESKQLSKAKTTAVENLCDKNQIVRARAIIDSMPELDPEEKNPMLAHDQIEPKQECLALLDCAEGDFEKATSRREKKGMLHDIQVTMAITTAYAKAGKIKEAFDLCLTSSHKRITEILVDQIISLAGIECLQTLDDETSQKVHSILDYDPKECEIRKLLGQQKPEEALDLYFTIEEAKQREALFVLIHKVCYICGREILPKADCPSGRKITSDALNGAFNQLNTVLDSFSPNAQGIQANRVHRRTVLEQFRKGQISFATASQFDTTQIEFFDSLVEHALSNSPNDSQIKEVVAAALKRQEISPDAFSRIVQALLNQGLNKAAIDSFAQQIRLNYLCEVTSSAPLLQANYLVFEKKYFEAAEQLDRLKGSNYFLQTLIWPNMIKEHGVAAAQTLQNNFFHDIDYSLSKHHIVKALCERREFEALKQVIPSLRGISLADAAEELAKVGQFDLALEVLFSIPDNLTIGSALEKIYELKEKSKK